MWTGEEVLSTLCCPLPGLFFLSLTVPVGLSENVTLYFLLFGARSWLGWCQAPRGGSAVHPLWVAAWWGIDPTAACLAPPLATLQARGLWSWAPRRLLLTTWSCVLVAWEWGASRLLSPFCLLQRQIPGLKYPFHLEDSGIFYRKMDGECSGPSCREYERPYSPGNESIWFGSGSGTSTTAVVTALFVLCWALPSARCYAECS